MSAWRLLVVLAAGCAASHGARIARMSSSCLERCEAYEVSVYADGFVAYRGWAHVVHGRRTAYLSTAKLAALDAAFAGFAAIDGHAIQCNIDDNGVLYTLEYRGRRISFFSWCDKVPYEVRSIVVDVERTLDVQRWFGTPEQRARLPESKR